MSMKNEKPLAGAGNTNEGNNETGKNSNTRESSSHELRRAIRKVEAAIANNNQILRRINEKSMTATPEVFRALDAKFGAVQKENTALNKQLRALVEECYEASQREWRAARKYREEEKRHEARMREEITRITGQDDLSPIDLKYEIVERYRSGGDYMTILDAMKAVDDLNLKRAGLSSWGEGDDECF
ncbi:hypothetical protein HMPREF2807_06210 [Corynebacterium sp. HMSC074A09]|nr:hypothetical protein HMPREF2807_06210 [Corynebacterium sp. HMSC074A09]